nr:cytochrome c oxidase assembly protein COX16 homolog, mitochondrial isoform X2 [Taeniopygia guttata]
MLSLLKKVFLCEHQPNCRGEDLNLQETLICEFFSNFVNFADTVSLCGINSKLAGDNDVTWYGISQRLGCDQLYLIGGSFGLREFAQIRYDVHKLHGKVDPALKEKLKQNTVTLESEYEKLEKSNLDNWENIRGPSLWEDSRTVQKQRREALRLKTE